MGRHGGFLVVGVGLAAGHGRPWAMLDSLCDAPVTAAPHALVLGQDRSPARNPAMCRNIKTLFNFEPPATELEIRDASLQFVRKLSGFAVPSKANEAAFERAVAEVAASTRTLLAALKTTTQPRDREVEAAKARERNVARFGARS